MAIYIKDWLLKYEKLQYIKDQFFPETDDENNKITVEEQNKMLEELGFSDVEWGKRYYLVTTVRAIRNKEK